VKNPLRDQGVQAILLDTAGRHEGWQFCSARRLTGGAHPVVCQRDEPETLAQTRLKSRMGAKPLRGRLSGNLPLLCGPGEKAALYVEDDQTWRHHGEVFSATVSGELAHSLDQACNPAAFKPHLLVRHRSADGDASTGRLASPARIAGSPAAVVYSGAPSPRLSAAAHARPLTPHQDRVQPQH